MAFFDRSFRKKPSVPASNPTDDDDGDVDDIRATGSEPINSPPEFIRAVELQRTYWKRDLGEQSRLEAAGIDQLGWQQLLRLHHLLCLQRLCATQERATGTEKCRQAIRRLITTDSPFRPRPAMIWQGQSAQAEGPRDPDMQGSFLNPSLTHLGCLEVYRVDAANQPTEIDFVGFDDLCGVMFAPPNLIRAAKLFYNDGRSEIVLVPMLYGLTWEFGNEFDRDGRMTRFVSHLEDEEIGAVGVSGMGVGQQDFSIRDRDGGSSLFGIASVAEISFPLDMGDPRFDEKARARGIDPVEVRRQMS